MHTVVHGNPPGYLSKVAAERCVKLTRWMLWANHQLYVFSDTIFRTIPPIYRRKNIVIEIHSSLGYPSG